jgi:RpiB/LacA/LacB family sugar-phosphate isomerase
MVRKNKILIASDHKGYKLKTYLIKNYPLVDLGPDSEESVDYNDYAKLLVAKLEEGDKGILICGTGLGISMAANRYSKARAALSYSLEMAKIAREHNDANILVLPGFMEEKLALQMIEVFLTTPFSYEERHKRRVEKLSSC